MGKSSYYVDKRDPTSVRALIEAFDVRGTNYEDAIRTALSIHDRAFILYVDHANMQQLSPLQDAFTFNIETDELVLFTDNPDALVDAVLEMAMFVRGFNTVMGIEDEWKTQVAIGAWRHVREALKVRLGLPLAPARNWSAGIELEAVERFNMMSFAPLVFLASRPDVEITFPDGANSLCITAYQRLKRIMEAIALNIGLGDHLTFNRRLSRALLWIEESILPKDISPFDNLFGPDGFADGFFEDDSLS